MRRVSPSFIGLPLLVSGVVLAGAGIAGAQEFSLQVGPPSAASPQPGSTERKVLFGLFAVRPIGCPDATAVTISATAEVVEAGVRRSVPLDLAGTSVPGVILVTRTWTGDVRVVRLVGRCADRTAGAIVTLMPSGAYHRDGVEHFAGAPTRVQVDRALLALATRSPAVAAAR